MTGQTPRRSRAAGPRTLGAGRVRISDGTGGTGEPQGRHGRGDVFAELKRRHRRLAVRFIDDVATPVDDGRYVTIVLLADAAPVEAVVLTTENFYDCLAKVMQAEPGSH